MNRILKLKFKYQNILHIVKSPCSNSKKRFLLLELFQNYFTYEGYSESSWNLVKKFSFIDIILSFFEISQVDINELTSCS